MFSRGFTLQKLNVFHAHWEDMCSPEEAPCTPRRLGGDLFLFAQRTFLSIAYRYIDRRARCKPSTSRTGVQLLKEILEIRYDDDWEKQYLRDVELFVRKPAEYEPAQEA